MAQRNTGHGRALAFRALHVRGRPLVPPGVRDTAGAGVVEHGARRCRGGGDHEHGPGLGPGRGDGDTLDRDRALTAVAGIAAAVDEPVSADIESGDARDAAGVAGTIREIGRAHV